MAKAGRPVEKMSKTALWWSRAMGKSRDAVQTRIDRWDIAGPPYDGAEIFELKPLNPKREGDAITLEEARRNLAVTQDEKERILLEELQKTRIHRDQLDEALSQAYGAMAATIKGSAMTEKEKDGALDDLKNIPNALGFDGDLKP